MPGSGGPGKKRGQNCQALYGSAPSLLAEALILQKHMQVPRKQAHHSGLRAPEVVGQDGASLHVLAANSAKAGNAGRQLLGQRRVFGMQPRQTLLQACFLPGIIQKKKSRLPHILQQGTAGTVMGLRLAQQRMQAQGIAPGFMEAQPFCGCGVVGPASGKLPMDIENDLATGAGMKACLQKSRLRLHCQQPTQLMAARSTH